MCWLLIAHHSHFRPPIFTHHAFKSYSEIGKRIFHLMVKNSISQLIDQLKFQAVEWFEVSLLSRATRAVITRKKLFAIIKRL